ncbi:hypothetical protein SKAU_G00012170 [Synaphobranchus kaupii]|uniref:Uncharacterized protein n=1 Tax=Synaphobranchus kaupii TaxID=118154 RepID=A0A9Q1GBG5_SYNKA|nr:hypothetical protein SKAU_G00012170 [Synaphobranchus kaupii]
MCFSLRELSSHDIIASCSSAWVPDPIPREPNGGRAGYGSGAMQTRADPSDVLPHTRGRQSGRRACVTSQSSVAAPYQP